ncbi:MAG TPA: SEC-C domain-containing protein [Opitutaceae bacterium]|jgi:hypothetical protein
MMEVVRSDAPEGGDEDSKVTLVEFLAFHLYAEARSEGSRDFDQAIAALQALRDLRTKQIFRAMQLGAGSSAPFNEATAHLRNQREFVRGDAYPAQTRALVEALILPFSTELTALAGIAPDRVLELLDLFQPQVENQLAAHRARHDAAHARLTEVSLKKGDGFIPKDDLEAFRVATLECDQVHEDSPWRFFVSFERASALIASLTAGEWNALANILGLTWENRPTVRDSAEIKERPFYFLPEKGFTLFSLSSAYDAIFGVYDRLARSSPSLRERYGQQVATWMEHEVERNLLRLFPRSQVFRKLDYSDPDNPNSTAELDLAVYWGGCLMPIEAKGRQFRLAAQDGNTAALRTDLQRNIAEAFWQCRRVLRYLDSVSHGRLIERDTGRILEIDCSRVRRRFPVVVTLEHFAGLATQLAMVGADQWFQAGTYPWAVSLADWETITHFAGSPDVLLHYARRRIQLQESKMNISGDELDLFSHYLDNRLHPSIYWERRDTGRPFTMLNISDGEAKFADRLQAESEGRTPLPEVGLCVPPAIAAVLGALRQSSGDEDRSIAITLLDLSPNALNQIAKNIARLNAVVMPPGRQPRMAFREDDTLVLLLGNRGLDPAELQARLTNLTAREKYRTRAPQAIGMAFDPSQAGSRFFAAVWLQSPWIHDVEIERDLSASPLRLVPGTRRPQPNDRCPCGSGLKFKRCCRDRADFVL